MEGGKWGLVIIFAAFMIQVLAFGVTAAIGVYNIELLDYFKGATVEVSLIGSLNFGIFLGSGPVVSFLLTKFSYRKIALFGSCLIVIGLLGMPLLPYIPAMCICFGVLTGFGSCCAYIPSHVLSGLYYDKHRSLATGLATSGSGLGGAILPVLTGLLIDVYSWKGSFIFVAGLCLHLIIFSALLRDPPPLLEHTEEVEEIVVPVEEIAQGNHDDQKTLVSENFANHGSHNGTAVPDTVNHDFVGLDMGDIEFMDSVSFKRDASSSENISVKARPDTSTGHVVFQDNSSSWPGKDSHLKEDREDQKLIHRKSRHVPELKRHESLSVTSIHTIGSTHGASYLVVNRNVDIQHSVPYSEAKENTKASEVKIMPKSSRHIYIFTDYGFDIYFFSNIMWNAGCSIISAFIPEFLRERGLTPMEAAWLSGAFGFGCFIGGILGGLFGNFKCVNRQVLYTAANLLMGLTLIVLPSFHHTVLYTVFLVAAGIGFGIILGLLIVVLTDLIGVESLGNGLGYLMLSNGMGTFAGPPMAGFLKESTGSFDAGIILAGVLGVLGGVIMLLMPCKRILQRRFKSGSSHGEKQ